MNDALLVFLSLSVSGSVLVLILLAIKPLVKKRLSQTWQYYIWLIVILRFLLPFTSEVTLIGELSNHLQNIPVSSAGIDERQAVDINGGNIADQSTDTFQAPNQVTQDSGTKSPVKTSYWRESKNNVWMIWLAIALILLVHKIMSYHNFIRFVKVGAKAVANQHLLDIYKSELEAAKIRRKLPFYVNAQVTSPMLIGFFRPAIIIPMLSVNDDELRQIFRHELTHYRRSDAVYKWLIQIALCIHWFNPFVYWIRKEINRCCELSCDESVIKNLDRNSRIVYGDALIASLNTQGNHKNFNISLTMGEDANLIKERLDMMMNYKKKSKFVVCVTFLLTILFLFSFSFLGAYASSPNSSKVAPNINITPVALDPSSETKNIKNITLFVDDTNVTVRFSENDQFLYDYDKTMHRITSTIADSNMEIKVERQKDPQFASITDALNDMIVIYLPDRSYDDITVEGKHSGISLPGLDANLNLTSTYGSIGIQIPEHFTKTINLTHQKGSGSMVIDSNAKDYAVKVNSEGSSVWVSPSLPAFTPDKTWEYKNGKGTAKINIYMKYSSFTVQFDGTETDNEYGNSSTFEPILSTYYTGQGSPAFKMLKKSIFKHMIDDWTGDDIKNPVWNYDSFTQYHILDHDMVSATPHDELYYCTFSADNDKFGYIVLAYDGSSLQRISTIETPYLYDLRANIDVIADMLLSEAELDLSSAVASRVQMLDTDKSLSDEAIRITDGSGHTYIYYFEKSSEKGQSSQNSKSETTNLSEYAKWEVTYKDGIFYYGNHQIRLFMDVAADNSFKNFSYDENGSVDLRLIRNSKGSIVKSEYISEDEADEVLSDFDVSSSAESSQNISVSLDRDPSKSVKASEDIMRQTTEELPTDIQKAISSCDNKTWYVLDGQDRRYIYYNGLTHDYAYQYAPNENNIVITDIGKSTGNYVLLSIPLSSGLIITYHSHSVAYTKITVFTATL